MTTIFLQDIIEDLRFEDLPPEWNSFDLESFSKSKKLWDYQQDALRNAIKVLWKYFEDSVDYQSDIEVNQERKQRFFQWYEDNGLDADLSIKLDKRNRNIYNLLTAYYPQDNGRIRYEHLINRMCLWMATGSGKTLVIIKLIQILKDLIERGEIPPHDILVLTYRDDLIEQFKKLIAEFNYAGNGVYIQLKELKEYPEVKRQQILFGKEEVTVFYYRSDNLSDEQKEKIIDFRNYDNDGKWYIFLDEAHKGDKEESKRQHIYSILSRNGFLFNSSATFIDARDIITCAYEFNLSSFINAGYGKHIAILKQEIRAFRDNENYSDEEKQKIVLKSLILLTCVKKSYQGIAKIERRLYHNPLLLTLVNSVNTEDADLKRFFGELERIGKGEIEEGLFSKALDELWEELKREPDFMFEGGNKVKIEEAVFRNITKKDVLKYIYNAESFGEIEVSFRPSDKKQVAFKLTTTDKHFALTKTGDMPAWLKEELSRFNINHEFEEEGFFERINRDDSPINILMGSRAFYEGWDSNRPNVINYINIGMGEDARKFILQSVGRGVRIEPIKDKRKRLLSLYNAKEIDGDLFHKIKDKALPIETLFIFGTNRDALKTVVERLQVEGKLESETQLPLFDINLKAEECKLLVPVYKEAEQPIFKTRKQTKFPISVEDFGILNKFSEFVPDDRVLLMKYAEKLKEPGEIKVLRQSLNRESDFYNIGDNRNYKNIDLLIQRIFGYLNAVPKEFEGLKELKEEIRHFKHIKVYLKDISEIQKKIETVKNYPNKRKRLEGELSKVSDEIREEVRGLLTKEATETYEHNHKRIKIKYVANHYYIPLVLSEDEKVDYVKHIIKTPSEAKFIDDLEGYLARSDNKFKEFDWWLFSKLDESLDEVYIPYYNPNANKISNFFPDFIFWLKKGNNYFILFVDPKGIEHISGWAYKINNGYRELFEENGSKNSFNHDGFKVEINLKFRTDDVSKVPAEYRQYWFDNIEGMLEVGG